MDNLIAVNVTVDQIQQGWKLLRRFNTDNQRLTEVTVISNAKDIPVSQGSVRYEALALDTFIGEKITDWDGHSPMTLYFTNEGVFDHYEKTTGAKAGAVA